MADFRIINLFLIELVFLLFAVSADSADIRLKGLSKVSGEQVFLKDIAEINAPEIIKKKIGSIRIGYSPLPGEEKLIQVKFIKSKIENGAGKIGTKIIPPGEFLCVRRDFQVVSEKRLKNIYFEFIKNRVKEKKFKIRSIKIRGNKKLPPGRVKLELKRDRDKRESGNIRIVVEAIPENGKSQRILISGWVDIFKELVYAGKMIDKGMIINEEDIYSTLTNTTRYPADVITSVKLAKGKVARRRIRKDSVLRQSLLGVSPDIKKGDQVRLVVTRGTLRVTTLGVAQESACIGEQVKVKNISSKKRVTGRVLEDKRVSVVY